MPLDPMCWPLNGSYLIWFSIDSFPRTQLISICSSLKNEKSYITVINLNNDVELVNLDAVFAELTAELSYVVVSDKSLRRKE